MKAAVLEDVATLRVQSVNDPAVAAHQVLVHPRAVGVCGTDLHIYQGHANYNLDAQGRAIPLRDRPQILGHEFAGVVMEIGSAVKDLRPGDRVLCDQGLNCVSQGLQPVCEYCASGDSHQCANYREHGITGMQGAMAEYIAMPAVNCVRLPEAMPWDQGALVEPLACILHSSERAENAAARYKLGGEPPVRHILICGAGPAGLLFLQYLRNVRGFEGLILISDLREKNLELARRFGGTPVNSSFQNLFEAVHEHTHGERIDYLIESCGAAAILEQMPALLRKQGTVLLYGHGHKGRDVKVLSNILFLEPALVAAVGASGGFEADGRPSVYRRSLDLVNSGKVQVLPFLTHRYQGLEQLPRAFAEDFSKPEYIKGLMDMA